jgi:hypothetical protein
VHPVLFPTKDMIFLAVCSGINISISPCPHCCSPPKSRACPCLVSPLHNQTRINGKIKASLRVPREAVGLPYRKHKERRNAVAFSSTRYRPVEISYVSLGDRFAAMQIVMVTEGCSVLCPFY